MNGRILIAVGVAIVAIMAAIIYLEQGESKVPAVNLPTSNITQSTNQSTTSSITVATDKSSYSMGDAIVISGAVKSPLAGTPVTILILDPNNLLLQAERILVSSDGSFHDTVMTTPAIWKQSGTYAVSVQYGPSNTKAQTTFYFAG
jgi:hypothetical protein